LASVKLKADWYKAPTSLDRQVTAPIGQGEDDDIRSAFNAISPAIWHLFTIAF
jgi:hypothetical protein